MITTELSKKEQDVAERLRLLRTDPESVAQRDAGEILKRFTVLTEGRTSGFLAYFVHGLREHDLTHEYLIAELGLPTLDNDGTVNAGQPSVVFDVDGCTIKRHAHCVDENGRALDTQYEVECLPPDVDKLTA